MGYEWLKSKRLQHGWKQEALASALSKSVRVIRRWENCEEGVADIPYARLAELFEMCQWQLREDHARDLEAVGTLDQARELRAEAMKQKADDAFQDPVEWKPIEVALEACRASGFTDAVLHRMKIQNDLVKAAKTLASWLESGDWEAFTEAVDMAFEEAAKHVRDDRQHDALRQFLLTIVIRCAAKDENLKGKSNAPYTAYAQGRPWAYRAFADRSLGRDSLGMIRSHPEEPQYRLDDDPGVNRAMHSGLITQNSEDDRLHELVHELAGLLGIGAVTPPITETDRFGAHCKLVNRAIATHNSRNSYVIGIWGRYHLETPGVLSGLMKLLPALRLFDEGQDGDKRNTLIRIDLEVLETWLAYGLNLLDSVSTGDTHEKEKGQHHCDDKQSDAQLQEQLIQLSREILATTSQQSDQYTDLRRVVEELLEQSKTSQPIRPDTPSRIQRINQTMDTTDRVTGTVSRLLTLIQQIPGVGS